MQSLKLLTNLKHIGATHDLGKLHALTLLLAPQRRRLPLLALLRGPGRRDRLWHP